MSYRTVKFCFVCGSPTKIRYPFNDPEAGPAEPRCSADMSHSCVQDMIDDAIGSMSDEELMEIMDFRKQEELAFPMAPETEPDEE